MDSLFLLFAITVFVAVVLLVEALYLNWNSAKGPEAKRLERRLRIMSAGGNASGQEVSILKQRLLSESPALQRILLSIPRVQGIDRLLEQSGLPWSVSKFLLITVIAAIAGFMLASLLNITPLIALAIGVGAALLPLFYIKFKKAQRLTQIDQQLPDALDLIGRAMRAGHAFPSALKMVGDEMAEPLSGEFRIAFDEVNYGITMQDALSNLANRVPSTDLRYFVIAVLIQRETGGNLTELLDNISRIIRARIKLLGDVRVLSAEGKMSAWILTLLPFCAGLMMHFANPTFMEVLFTDKFGQKLVGAAIGAMLLGILWMRSIIRIRI
jgi:tight adherence protein B